MALSLEPVGALAGHPAPAVPTGARLALRFVALNVLTGTAGGVLQLGVPLLALSLGASSAQVGLIRSVAGVGMLAVVIPVGFLVDRFGTGRVFQAGAMAGAAIALAYSSAPSSVLLVLLMAIEGMFAPLRFTALTASFYEKLPSIGLDKAGWFKASMSTGLTFLGPLAGGLLARSAGFPALFGVVVVLHLLSASVATVIGDGAARPCSVPARPRLRDQAAELVRLLRGPAIHPVLVAELLGAATFSAFTALVVVVAVRVFAADAAVASRILVIEGLAFVVTALVGGRFTGRASLLPVAAAAAGVAGAIGTALASGPAALALAGVAVGISTGLYHAHVASWIAGLDARTGRVAALFQTAAGLGLTAGPLASALAQRWLGARAGLVVFVPFFLALAWRAVRASKARAHHRDGPVPGRATNPRSEAMALERQHVPQYLNGTPFIILATVDRSSAPVARTIASFAADGLTVYFSTGKSSDKVGQIGVNPNVSVLFQHEGQELQRFANVEIRGRAEVLADGEEKQKAIRLISARNPRFEQRAKKGELGGSALVRVTPSRVKVVDLSSGIGPAAVSTFEP